MEIKNVKKNILLVSNMYPSKRDPNYGVFVKNTKDILESSNYTIKKIVINKQNNKFFKMFLYIKHYISIVILGINKKYNVLYVHYASHNSIPILFLSKINKSIKIYTNVHGSDVVPENKIHEFFQPYVKKLLSISDCVIVPSNYYKDKVANKYEIDLSKIKIFPSGGINSKVFYDKQNDEERKYIGFVGRIEYQKGWDIFLKFISKVKDLPQFKNYKFVVVGDGKQMEAFNKLIYKLGISENIEKHSFMNQEGLNDVYNKMEVFCFPTMREGESLGLVGLEAMACGVPVIGSNIGGLKDYIIDGENGYLFESGNVEELADKMLEFISKDPQEKLKFKHNSIKTSRGYEVENISSKLVDIFNGL